MMELYYNALIGIAILAIPVLWSADRYLARKLGDRHDRGLQWLIACFFLWVLNSWAARKNNADGYTGAHNQDWVMMQYIISGAVNVIFLIAMSFFRPDASTRLGRFYQRINWKTVVGALIGASFILFTVFREPVVRDWLDVQISSMVILLFTTGMAMIFWHRRLPLMAAVALLNGVFLVLVQGDQYRLLHAGEAGMLPALGSGIPEPWGQVLHLIARPGLVFCLLMLALSWHGEQAEVGAANGRKTAAPDRSGENRLVFTLHDNTVHIQLWLAGRAGLLDLSGLPASDKERLVSYARLVADGKEIGHKDYTNFSRDKFDLIRHINELISGDAEVLESDLFIQNSRGRSTLRIAPGNIVLPQQVQSKYD